jgi:uncharacterized protein
MSENLPSHTNRLIHQKSPYLLQHAHNPVDWYSWSPEAFQAAKDFDKPIFLSIGYSTCHWCHVMEKESFEDVELARLMNDIFINIKVDREELPEVDALYIEFAQSMMADAAGWPLNVILTPELQPFFAATYLPPKSRQGMMGMFELIYRIKEVWQGEEREKILLQANRIVEAFASVIHTKGDFVPRSEQVDNALELLYKTADPVYGGMLGAPKFPLGYQLSFMLRYSAKKCDSRALFVVERTLEMMRRGGIYDHLGGGFSRYSVDERWLIPHFEKMLYDNALLAQCYLEAWQMTKQPDYRHICESIFSYILRDMTHPDGGFYSAEDADTEGEEGLFYSWTLDEVRAILGENGDLFCEFYDITSRGNFGYRNVLNTRESLEEFTTRKELDPKIIGDFLRDQAHRLWMAREHRIHPQKDDKILSSWNGLMIYSLALAGKAFDNKAYLEAALKAAHFIRNNMWREGQLYRRWREGETMFSAGLDEYAYLIRSALALFECDAGAEWLKWAIEMTEILKDKFKEVDGAFYQIEGLEEKNLILRQCHFSDGAEPSGNAVHCENLIKLYQITGDQDYLSQAADVLKAVMKYLDMHLLGYSFHLMNLLRYYDKKRCKIVIALNEKEDLKKEISQLLFQSFIPHDVIIWRRVNDPVISKLLLDLVNQTPQEGKTTLYICHEGVCQEPLDEFSDMVQAIHEL